MQNNETHTVTRVDLDTLQFWTCSKRDGRVREWQTAQFHAMFRPAYCITVHKAQGDTLEEDFVIWEAERMPPRHQYTAMTRARRRAQISLGALPPGFGLARDQRVCKALAAKVASYRADDTAKGRLPACDLTAGDLLDMVEACGATCVHCGEGLKLLDFTRHDPRQVTLDRIRNSEGHTRGNVVVACLGCNQSHAYETEKNMSTAYKPSSQCHHGVRKRSQGGEGH